MESRITKTKDGKEIYTPPGQATKSYLIENEEQKLKIQIFERKVLKYLKIFFYALLFSTLTLYIVFFELGLPIASIPFFLILIALLLKQLLVRLSNPLTKDMKLYKKISFFEVYLDSIRKMSPLTFRITIVFLSVIVLAILGLAVMSVREYYTLGQESISLAEVGISILTFLFCLGFLFVIIREHRR